MVKNLVLLGLPGAGKGTQAAFITEDYQLVHISTGDIFRANLSENTALGQQAREYMDAGNLVPDEITNAMVADRLNQSDVADGFMLDGYPRNHEQAVFLDKYLSDKGQAITGTLYFEVADATLRDRLLSRGRADDTPEVIANRLEINKAANMPLVDYYREAGVLHAIDGSRDVADVYADVKQALDQLS